MNEVELKARTKRFGLRVMKLVDALPNTMAGRAIGSQLVRSGTSVGANYRAACRSRSKAEFIAKIGVVAEEADESAFWLELITDGDILGGNMVDPPSRRGGGVDGDFYGVRPDGKRRTETSNDFGFLIEDC